MHILIATDAFPPVCGGSGWSSYELARGLRARGHRVTIVQPKPGTPRGTRERTFDALRVIEFGAAAPAVPYVRNYFKNERLYALLADFLADLVARERVDLVHGQHVLTCLPSIAAARRTSVPVVCTIRDYWPVCYWSDLIHTTDDAALCPGCSAGMMTRCVRPHAGALWPAALPMIPYMRGNLARKRHGLAAADAIVAVSTTIASDLRARAPEIRNTRLEIIPNPVDVTSLIAAGRESNAPIAGPYALYIGKLAPNKGTMHLVPVIENAALDWPLVIAGTGPEQHAIAAAAAASRRDVRMIGWIDQRAAAAWMAHASMLIFPSRGPESLSRVLIEASALGLPIAAMNTGGTAGERGAKSRGGAVRLAGRRCACRSALPGAHGWQGVTSGRLRVAVLSRAVFPLHGLGGLERSVHDLVRHLAEAGVQVTVITRPATAPVPADAWPEGVTLRFVPYRTFPFAGRRGTTILDRSTAYPLFGERAGRVAWDLATSGAIDLVHGFGASVLGFARRRSRGSVPLVLNPQGLEEFGGSDPARARLKRAAYLPLRRAVLACARSADCVIATDRSLEPIVRSHLHLSAERVCVIPNALDLRDVDALATASDGASIRAGAGIGRDEAVLLSVGRIEENKGFHVLVAALAALRDHAGRIGEGRWRWVLVGDGPFRGRLEKAVSEARLRDHVVLAGRATERDLHAWYEAADLFVHPTLYEGSSLVTLEAMAHRRAVVATTAGGLTDKVRPGVNGWLVPPGDASALSGAISGALGRHEDLPTLGSAGRAIVEREFSWTSAVRQTIALYERLIS
jgi:glycogen(starch) synthase